MKIYCLNYVVTNISYKGSDVMKYESIEIFDVTRELARRLTSEEN